MRKTRNVIALLMVFLVLAVFTCSGLACQKKPGESDLSVNAYRVFDVTKETYSIAHTSIVRLSRTANGVAVVACKKDKTDSVCVMGKKYAKFYKETLQPASVKADKAYTDALQVFDAYLAGTDPEAKLFERIEALNKAMSVFQKYFNQSDAMTIIESVGDDQSTGGES